MFITLEGVEGSGKTTLVCGINEFLKGCGYSVLCTREPGGNAIAESIREIILDTKNTQMDARTEALLYAAARRQHLVDVVIPALDEGKIVICDRFVDSSIAYQGYARKIGADLIADINDFAISKRRPDLTLLIDILPEVGLARINKDKSREVNRLDLENLEFHKKVYEGYQEIAKKPENQDRIKVIDGDRPVDEILENVFLVLKERLKNG